LFIKTLQPLGLTFFDSINKFLTIVYFEPFSTSFYLLFFSCMLYNCKWYEYFQACSQLALNNESKEAPPFWTFFHTNVSLWSIVARSFVGPKKDLREFESLYRAIYAMEISKQISICSQVNILQDAMVTCV